MFSIVEITNHGKSKYQILSAGGKHICYLNSKQEAETLIRYLNREYKA